ncbi:hypothetical protein BJ138DRAFT_593419 [Hygrophoropsis aurantiaca]|uniref:Uncharacterized protein n=1 Tax=Hygrophoropsis aurantiaca TaxID=72124 RepID=A0ACB8ATW6_9AGAM|nr:hypothetical protein BJ138DRAFT_593419 [Hygrophoropsis aurantiaca]
MKFISSLALVSTISVAAAELIRLGYPTDGAVLTAGQSVAVQVIQPEGLGSCIQVGIALAVKNCDTNGVCSDPAKELGSVLYAGPFEGVIPLPGGWYQNFTVQIPEYLDEGKAIFTLTHLCLLGGAPFPYLEFRNASVTIA